MVRWILVSLLILFSLVFVPLNQGQEKAMESAELYDFAMELYYRGKYDASIDHFSELIRTYPTSKSVPYAIFMVGQCYLGMGRPEEAVKQFELYLKSFSEGDRRAEAEDGIQVARGGGKERLLLPPPLPSPLPSPPPPAAKRVKRRICAQVFYLNEETLGEVDKRFRELKRAGVDTVIFRVFQAKGDRMYKFANPRVEEGVYFRTENAPVVDDLLGKIIEIAHRNELDLFAWMTTRYADYGSDGNPDLRCVRYNFETKRMEPSRGLTLFHPEVLKRLQGLFRELGRYPVDGILLQDDLILRHNEDFSAEAVKSFLKEFGYHPHPDIFYVDPYRSESGKYYVGRYTDRFWSWARWKNRWLLNVAQQLMTSARESNPQLQFAINLYYEAVLNDANGVAWFSQTLSETLMKDFDYYAIMAYHRQTMREFSLDEKGAIRLMGEVAEKALRSARDPSQVMMKLQIMDWKSYKVVPTKEVDEVLTGILSHGNVSLAFVPYVDQFPIHLLKGKWNSPAKPAGGKPSKAP